MYDGSMMDDSYSRVLLGPSLGPRTNEFFKRVEVSSDVERATLDQYFTERRVAKLGSQCADVKVGSDVVANYGQLGYFVGKVTVVSMTGSAVFSKLPVRVKDSRFSVIFPEGPLGLNISSKPLLDQQHPAELGKRVFVSGFVKTPAGLKCEAEKKGEIRIGDEIVEVQGEKLRGFQDMEAFAKFIKAKPRPLKVVFLRKRQDQATAAASAAPYLAIAPAASPSRAEAIHVDWRIDDSQVRPLG
jgi:hypothetical protein